MQYFAGTVETIDFQLPEEMSISRVYPNPFNASINIEYQLDHYADSRLLIYDIQGKMIIDREVSNASPGTYIWTWNAKNNNGRSVPSGAYFIQLIQGEVYSATHKVVLLK